MTQGFQLPYVTHITCEFECGDIWLFIKLSHLAVLKKGMQQKYKQVCLYVYNIICM